MSANMWMIGHRVELMEMLDGREKRAAKQQQIRDAYPGTLICFTLNIAGPVKVFPLSEELFLQTSDRIQELLWRHQITIRHREHMFWTYGWEAYVAVDADALVVKRILLELEENDPAGRLYDIDVLRPDGTKVSRTELGLAPRACLVCGSETSACARSRAHSVEELQEKTVELMLRSLRRNSVSSDMIGRLCRLAMLLEVYTTPKPGLVDRNNTGSHKDMDVSLFETSTQTLEPFFVRFAETGRELYEEAPENILRCIRPIGIEAEEAMFEATGGINTHKGMIFSLGILATATGHVIGRRGSKRPSLDGILKTAGLIAAPAWRRDFEFLDQKEKMTAGEEQFTRYGIGGIRKEAADGFPSVRLFSWPVLSASLDQGTDFNQAGSLALLNLIAHVVDTNMIARSSVETHKKLQEKVVAMLKNPAGIRESQVVELDQEFIRENVSPGGCADLLALTYFLYELSYIL